MPALPPRANLDHLRHQAKDLLHAARHGDSDVDPTIYRFYEIVQVYGRRSKN
jgi:cyanate lyase